jgi:hypothetical protein
MNRFRFAAASLAVSGFCLPLAQAEAPHEHGAARLNIAIDGSEVLLELQSPAVNMIGFEHHPSTDEQHQALEQAVALLREPDQLFLLTPEAGCTGTAADLESSLLEHEQHAEHDEHDEETHSEFHAMYTFSCAEPDKLNAIELALFALFPGLEDVDVQFIGPSGQLGMELTPEQNHLEF